MVDYGSSSYGRADEWSDVDVTLFIRDAEHDAFIRGWKEWTAGFGKLLLAYVGNVGHPWTVYDTRPVPLRVDFEFQLESQIHDISNWENSPISVEAMVLYDGSDGRLTSAVQHLVGKSLAPADPPAAFERLCGDFWYFLLYSYSKLQRGEQWVARMVFESESVAHLAYLLRLEADAVQRWRWSQAAYEVERTLSPERLQRLNGCIAPPSVEGLLGAMVAAARLGREVCCSIAAEHGWPWPAALGDRVVELLSGET